MPREVVGKIPEFASEETPTDATGTEEVKKASIEEIEEKEKETLTELPAGEKPAEEAVLEEKQPISADTEELLKQLQGLQNEREKLLLEIQELRGQRRELKEKELQQTEEKIDELKDLHPEDIEVIERILKAKGYITSQEAQKMYFDSVKQEQLNKFLEKYPEYKPENDKNDLNWNALQRELSYYKIPENPHQIGEILERAHRNIQRFFGDRSLEAKKKQVQIAGVGASGTQRSSFRASLNPRYKEELLRGGWSEEDIKEIEKNLPEE